MACANSPELSFGVKRTASAHSALVVADLVISPSIAAQRVSTRLTLPSQMTPYSCKPIAIIAPAVDGPTPDIASQPSKVCG